MYDTGNVSICDTYWRIFKDLCSTVCRVLIALSMTFIRIVRPLSNKCVENKIVLITGAGSGLGRYLSLEFCKLGSVVVLWDNNENSLKETIDFLNKFNDREAADGINSEDKCELKLYYYVCNVGDKADVYRTAERVRKEVGDVGILINNAAVVTGKSLLDTPDERIIETFNVNLLSHFWTVKSFLPSMLTHNDGHIVSMASSCGFAGISKLLDYSATKYGVIGFSEVLNYENIFSGYNGVHVTTVCPSFVKTGMFHGCRMRYQSLVPDLEVTATVERIMEGILRNEHFVYIPRRIGIMPFCKSLLPYDAWMAILRFLGADTFMDSFEGRSNVNT